MKIIDFITKYRITKENREYNEFLYSLDYTLYKEVYKFYLSAVWVSPFSPPGPSKFLELLELDDEDLQYLYNKYSKKLPEELESEIKKLKEEYENTKRDD
jgi:hypothetical protein